MNDTEPAQRYLDGISLQSHVVTALLAKAGATGATLAPFVEPRSYRPDDVIIEQGSRPEALLLVLRGSVTAAGTTRSVVTGRESEAVEINQLGRYDVLGEVSMITRQPAVVKIGRASCRERV